MFVHRMFNLKKNKQKQEKQGWRCSGGVIRAGMWEQSEKFTPPGFMETSVFVNSLPFFVWTLKDVPVWMWTRARLWALSAVTAAAPSPDVKLPRQVLDAPGLGGGVAMAV